MSPAPRENHICQRCYSKQLTHLGLSLTLLLTFNLGCASPEIVTVTFLGRDANTEQWICDRKAKNCHGKGADDLRFEDYQPDMAILSPPEQCPHGAARIEIAVQGKEVVQVGFTCAQPNMPTGPATPTGKTMPTQSTEEGNKP